MSKKLFRLVFLTLLMAATFFIEMKPSFAQTCNQSGGVLTCDGTESPDTFTIDSCLFPEPGCLSVNGNEFLGVTIAYMNGLGGNDFFSVTATLSGLLEPSPTPPFIYFDGGTGSDSLQVTGTPDTPVDHVVYDPGPGVSEGKLTYTDDSVIAPRMYLQFVNLELVAELLTAPDLIINGTNGDNAINYQDVGGGIFGVGLVTVDGFAPIQFVGKTVLSLDGLAGVDAFNLNRQPALPFPPSGLTQISVNGGDPTGGDSLLINGTPASDTITVQPTGIGSAQVTGAQMVLIDVATTELLTINGLGGGLGGDELHFETLAGDQSFELSTGNASDNGSVLVTDNGLRATLIPIQFLGLGTLGDLVFDGGSGVNSFVLKATDGDDNINADNFAANAMGIQRMAGGLTYLPVTTSNISRYLIQTLEGNDFVLAQNTGGGLGQMAVDAGGPASGDRLVFGGGTGDIILDLFNQTITEGNFFQMGYVGFEEGLIFLVNLDLTVQGGANNDIFHYQPINATDGSVDLRDHLPAFQFFDAASLSFDGMGGSNDQLVVDGTPGNDTIGVNNPGIPQVGLSGFLPASMQNLEFLEVNGLGGDDTFNATGLASIGVMLDGGPHANGDTLNFDGLGLPVTSTSTSFSAAGLQPVSYFNIENVNVTNSSFVPPPPGGSLQFSAAVFRNFENDVFATITVNRTGDGLGEASVDFATSDGTGENGVDYTATSGTLTWPNGVTGEMSFQVPLIDNNLQDGSRTVNLALGNLVTTGGAVLGTPTNATILISDNEGVQQNNNNGGGGGCSLRPGSPPQFSAGFGIGLLLLVALFLGARSRT
jgi:Calx-beta domain.